MFSKQLTDNERNKVTASLEQIMTKDVAIALVSSLCNEFEKRRYCGETRLSISVLGKEALCISFHTENN